MTDERDTAPATVDESPPDQEALAPVEFVEGEKLRQPRKGIALCLSGGGSRAMLFHAGALIRLNELGILKDIKLVSSVSGGSITAGMLARRWSELDFDDDGRSLKALVVDPLRELCRHWIDKPAWVLGFVTPWSSPIQRFAHVLDQHLYRGMKLSAVSASPEFVINATNLASTVLWRFSQGYMADYRVGHVKAHDTTIATAVAASSAFPMAFAPLWLYFAAGKVARYSDSLDDNDYRRAVPLGDGGIYDNLGLEAAWKRYRTVFVSDGGGETAPDSDANLSTVSQVFRVMKIIDRQVRSLRKRLLIDSYKVRPTTSPRARAGAYWGIRTNIANYELKDALPCPENLTLGLAEEPTRLTKMKDSRQEQLINWGYAVADAAIRRHWPRDDAPWPTPQGFPYPASGLG